MKFYYSHSDFAPQANETPMTYKLTKAVTNLVNSYKEKAEYYKARADKLEIERNTYYNAILSCLEENAHLADGDNCTLITLKRALL